MTPPPPHHTPAVILRAAALSDQGQRERQEDAILHEPRAGFFGVFDGLGDALNGDKNSSLAASYLFDRWSRDGQPRSDGGLMRAWDAAVSDLNRAIYHGDTTATVGMVLGAGRCLMIAHIGDSGVTSVDARGVHRRTERHGEGCWVHKAMRGGAIFSRPTPAQRDKPDLHTLPLIPGDTIILHTDGLDVVLEDAAAVQAACQSRDPAAIARALIEGARARGEGGNASCVVLVVEADPNAAAPSISREALEAAGR